MTNEQAKKMLKAKLECLKRETSGTDFDCNNSNCDECPLCYEQGNMGEQKEALDMAIKALEQQPCEDTISRQAAIDAIMGEPTDAHYPSWYAAQIEKLPAAQPDLIDKIQNGINATNANDSYSCGMRNGMRWCMSLVDDEEPSFEECPSAQPDVPDIYVGDMVSRQAAIEALQGRK